MYIPQLTIITHFYNQHNLVKEHVARWKLLPAEVAQKIEFICIDDFSDNQIEIDKGELNLRLFRVLDDIHWNMPGCKNLGAFMSMADWLLFFDIDNSIEADGLLKILEAIDKMDKQKLYRFKRIEQGKEVDAHINTLLLYKKNFFKIGGLDEDFSGNYGFEDVHFNLLWNKKIGPSLLITDIEFIQASTQTVGLNRDTSINQKLIQEKIYGKNYYNSVGKIRFNWLEMEI